MGNSTSALFNATRASLLRPARTNAPVSERDERVTLASDLTVLDYSPAHEERSYEQFVERYSESLLNDVVESERPSGVRPRRVVVSTVPQMARLFSEHSAVSERPKERRVDMTSADYAVMEAALDVEYTGNPGNLPPTHTMKHDMTAPLIGAAVLGGVALGAVMLFRSFATTSTRA